MRVLITSTPGTGHVIPVVPVAAALRRAGHQVVWAVAADGIDHVRALGFDAVEAGMTVGERTGFLSDRLPELAQLPPDARRASLFAGFFALGAAPVMSEALMAIFDKFRPDLVIHELAELGAAPHAVARGVPHVTVGCSGYLARPLVAQVLHCVAPVWEPFGFAEPTAAQAFGSAYLHPFPESMNQRPTELGDAPVLPVRPNLQPPTGPSPAWIESFGANRPGVYVTAGLSDVITRQMPWSLVFEALGALDVDVLATIGPHTDVATLRSVPRNVHLERFVPLPLVLPRAHLVMSHGGAGTVLGAAAFGVPQVVLPMHADGFENAAAICSTGAAVACDPNERMPPQIRARVTDVLADRAYAVAARHLAEEIARMPTAADHVAVLESLTGG